VPGSDFKLRIDLDDLEIVVTWMLNQCKEKGKARTLNNRRQISPNEHRRMVAVKWQQRLIRLLRQDGQNYAIQERLPIYTSYLLVTLYSN
jgi:hypothetical protein